MIKESYIRHIRENILWILKNKKHKAWQSYVDIYHDRVYKSESEDYKRNQRVSFGAIQQFDLHGEYPDRKVKNRLIKRGAYYRLIPNFKRAIDFYRTSDEVRDLEERTIRGSANNAAAFLYEMQKRGIDSLGCIGEEDALSFFLDREGNLSKRSSYKKNIASVFKVAANWKHNECRRILSYLPQIRPRRKNIQFLAPEEVASIRSAIDGEILGLSLRDRAIGKLLFFTGIRACDIADMKLSAINWETDEIHVLQQKTDQPLVLPLTATVARHYGCHHTTVGRLLRQKGIFVSFYDR